MVHYDLYQADGTTEPVLSWHLPILTNSERANPISGHFSASYLSVGRAQAIQNEDITNRNVRLLACIYLK